MDLSKPVLYRSQAVNNVVTDGRVLRGISIENINYSEVRADGYTEKRAGADGVHASDVYMGPRRCEINGLIYATSTAEAFDYLNFLRGVFSPTSAYTESPGDRGFLPLEFEQPTLDFDSFPDGRIPLQLNLRSEGGVRFTINRDRVIGVAGKPTSIPWSVGMFAKDPRVYINPAKTVDISGAANPGGTSAQAINRGQYETPLNIMLVIGTTAVAKGTFTITGLNGIDMDITIEAGANRVYRWFGDDRVLMVQDTTQGAEAPFVLRMDLVNFNAKNRRPGVPASINPPSRPFSTGYTRSCTVALSAGSRLFWNEAYA